jgi:hypothetical protein
MYTEFEQEEEEEVNNIAFRTCIARQSPRIGSWGPFSCRILISKTNPFPGVGWPSKVNFQTGCPGAARLINYTFPQDFPPTSHVCFTDANFSGANFRWEMPPLPPPPPAPRLRPASTSFISGFYVAFINLPPFPAHRDMKVPGVSTSSDQRE